jgi:predicted metal-dependent hydrolase
MTIPYTLKRSRKARRISITVKQTGDVFVTMPWFAPARIAESFVKAKSEWIQNTQEKLKKKFENKIVLKQTRKDYLEHKDRALVFIKERVNYFNQFYNFSFKKITIKKQISRWGSCSSKGNLNFNYSLIHIPRELADYIVVHELCHLKEMNHGKNFWNLVAHTLPHHKELRAELRKKYIHVQ